MFLPDGGQHLEHMQGRASKGKVRAREEREIEQGNQKNRCTERLTRTLIDGTCRSRARANRKPIPLLHESWTVAQWTMHSQGKFARHQEVVFEWRRVWTSRTVCGRLKRKMKERKKREKVQELRLREERGAEEDRGGKGKLWC